MATHKHVPILQTAQKTVQVQEGQYSVRVVDAPVIREHQRYRRRFKFHEYKSAMRSLRFSRCRSSWFQRHGAKAKEALASADELDAQEDSAFSR